MSFKRFFRSHWAELLFLLVVLLRLPSLFEPFTYGDEGIYVALGQAVRKGVTLYRDIHDNKPPLLYLMAAIAGNFEYFRLILFGWSLVTILAFYQLSRQIFPENKTAQAVSTGFFAFLTSIHTFEGNVANAENFMMLPIITGLLLILRSAKFWSFFLAGMLFSLAVLFKVPAAFDFAAALVILFFLFLEKKKKNYSLLAIHYLLLILGFLLPLAVTFLYYASQGALNQYLRAAFLQNIPYLSSWTSSQAQVGGLPLPLLGRSLSVFLLVIILLILKKRISFAAKTALVWFAFSWFAALLSSRPYPHYLLQVMPAFSLSAGLLSQEKTKWLKEKFIAPILIFILLLTFVAFRFWLYANSPYYLNFYQFALGVKTREEYFNNFDPRAKVIYQAADYLKSHTLPAEKIFIWGNDPFVYAMAERLPVGRYTVAYHIVDFDGYQETLQALQENPPRYLIISDTESRSFTELTSFVQANYFLEEKINGVQIFHRRHLLSRTEIHQLLGLLK